MSAYCFPRRQSNDQDHISALIVNYATDYAQRIEHRSGGPMDAERLRTIIS